MNNQCPKCKNKLIFEYQDLWFCSTCIEYLKCVNIKIWQEVIDVYLMK